MLTRRVGEAMVLPGVRTRIVVFGVSGGRVRLGVLVPPVVERLRAELEAPGPAGGPKVARLAPARKR